MVDETHPVVEVVGATVRFPAELALDRVDFRMFPGEVHSLMGENGAGKSTLIKALTGALPLDAGVIRLNGERMRFGTPHDALAAGISTVYQEIDLLPNLTVAENIWLGREPRRLGVIDWRRMRAEAREVLASLGLEIDPASLLGSHSLAVQQLVAIARAIRSEVKVLVLDEPTSSLDLDEVGELFRVIRELKQRGWRSCSSRTSSTRSTRSATVSRCCAAVGSWASTSRANCCASTSCRRCSAAARASSSRGSAAILRRAR
ncbi:hypothetical protein GCM10025869_03020 [Homoserinibacter gongjuensis]|uniref:ABC transporter domain-containing protein n=1 Tax=Homoserinibacter gongjuensis TaxID=1162968 RepID=A0ABQ6JND7_9MICO|nr:hypothetical protein GCM10025869_03020 [Homoserinibacter gongjuensis]